KIMSWTDGMIVSGFEILTMEDYNAVQKELDGGANPRELKARLARTIVAQYFDEAEARATSERFDQLFQKKETPENVPTFSLQEEASAFIFREKDGTVGIDIINLLVEVGFAKSNSDAKKLILGRGVKAYGKLVEEPRTNIVPPPEGVLIQKGPRHFVRVVA
ncbi:MAG: hypothetical protein NUV84_03165, partial [Candidatus Uhrbacteria bacterium]|nr:hypothetical protein [Candidatus Uhrbacteria bacterium]